MGFQIKTKTATAGDRTGPIYELSNESGSAKAEIWPMAGFNCLKWQVHGCDILYSMPDWEQNPVPTRSGHPVLFPFPNRLAYGKLSAYGIDYQLPLTESTKTHSIHGFTPRLPWRVLGSGVTEKSAFVSARFRMSEQLENANSLWPGDGSLTLTYTLTENSLAVDAEVENFGDRPVPYGIGYHGYFRAPNAKADEDISTWLFQSRTDQLWECENNMPTGKLVPTPPNLNFEKERPLGDVQFDTLLTGLELGKGMRTIGTLRRPENGGALAIRADESFPHLVLFTPVHRRAFAIEPYTCATNAANLPTQQPTGWKNVAPGMKNIHRVEYCCVGLS